MNSFGVDLIAQLSSSKNQGTHYLNPTIRKFTENYNLLHGPQMELYVLSTRQWIGQIDQTKDLVYIEDSY